MSGSFLRPDESSRWQPGSTLYRRLHDLTAIQLPGQTNRMALVFDPLNDPVRCLHPPHPPHILKGRPRSPPTLPLLEQPGGLVLWPS